MIQGRHDKLCEMYQWPWRRTKTFVGRPSMSVVFPSGVSAPDPELDDHHGCITVDAYIHLFGHHGDHLHVRCVGISLSTSSFPLFCPAGCVRSHR